jgi:hypothetical protein
MAERGFPKNRGSNNRSNSRGQPWDRDRCDCDKGVQSRRFGNEHLSTIEQREIDRIYSNSEMKGEDGTFGLWS